MKFFTNLKLDTIKKRGALLVGATVIANFFNFVYNAYLGRSINIEDFAVISLLGSIFGLADLPINALGRSVTHKSAYFLGKNKVPARGFWLYMRKKGMLGAFIVTILWMMSLPFLYTFFQLENALPLLAISPIWFFGVLSSVDGGYVKGNLLFGRLAIVGIIDSFVRLITVIALVEAGLGKYVYFGLPLSAMVTFLLVFYFARNVKTLRKKTVGTGIHSFPVKFFATSALTKASATVYLTADVILVKHYLPAEQAGQYALLSLTGKMVYFAGSLFSQFMLPMVSHGEGSGKNSANVFAKLLLGTFLTSFFAFCVLGIFGNTWMPLLFGNRVTPILPFLGIYTGGMVAFTIATNIIAYHQIKGYHLLPFLGFILATLQILAITLFHQNVGQVATSVSIVGFVSLAVAGAFHLMRGRFEILWSNILDFFDLFKSVNVKKSGTKILVFNWRDTKHLWSGGAEVYIHELAREWTRMGHNVTLFCGNDGKHKRTEKIDGVTILRRGGFYTVYIWAALYYIFKFRGKFDIIIDSENGIPFFSPLFARIPVLLLIHHVHQEIFMQHLKFPWSYVAKFLEGRIMPLVYRRNTVVTVSESSKVEIIKANLATTERIEIVNPGITLLRDVAKKTKNPTFVYLGRLKPYKNVDVAIKAFSKVAKKVPDARLLIAGEGESKQKLASLAEKLRIQDKVKFFGKISERMKKELLATSWVALQPSTIEGWGITVLEANAHKTPVIASNVNGLKDSIVDRKTGLLVELKNVTALEKAMFQLISDKKLRNELSINAHLWAKEFSWSKNAEKFYSFIETAIERRETKRILPNVTFPTLNRN